MIFNSIHASLFSRAECCMLEHDLPNMRWDGNERCKSLLHYEAEPRAQPHSFYHCYFLVLFINNA